MNHCGTGVLESEVGLVPMASSRRVRNLEIQRRVDRGRQLVARQRELVAKFGEQIPVAVALLKNYEDLLALYEKAQANFQRGEVPAGVEQAVGGYETVVADPVPNCLQPADDPKLGYKEQMRAVARLMEILSEGGYRCELARETLH